MNHSKTKITIFVRSSSIFNWLIINSTKQITPLSCLIMQFLMEIIQRSCTAEAPTHLCMPY